MAALAVHHDTPSARPGRHRQPLLEALRRRTHPRPVPALGDPFLQAQAPPKRHRDRVLHALGVRHVDRVRAEKRPVHAHCQHRPALERGVELLEQRLQNTHRRLAVVHVARPVADPRHLARVRLVRRDRAIARHRPPMRIAPPARDLDLQPRRHHRAVHVQRQPAHAAAPDRVLHELLVDLEQHRQYQRRHLCRTEIAPRHHLLHALQ